MGKQTKYEFGIGSFVMSGQLFTFVEHATVFEECNGIWRECELAPIQSARNAAIDIWSDDYNEHWYSHQWLI